MTLRLNGAGSGFTEIKAADTAGDNSIKLPSSNGSANQLLQNGGTAGELQYTSAGGGLHYDSSGRLLVGNTLPGAMNGGTIVAGDSIATQGGVALAVKYSSDNTLNTFGAMYSSANTLIGYGVRSSNSASNTFISTADISTFVRGALVVGGELSYHSAGAQNTTIGSEVTLLERIRITSNGTIRLLNSPGIDFSGIQTNAAGTTSETLDSYEEGTFTPTVSFSGGNGDLSYSRQNGYYTKIGRQVAITLHVGFSETTASGTLTITGLPFSSANNTFNRSAFAAFGSSMTGAVDGLIAALLENSSTLEMYYQNAGNAGVITNTQTGTGSLITIAGVYFV